MNPRYPVVGRIRSTSPGSGKIKFKGDEGTGSGDLLRPLFPVGLFPVHGIPCLDSAFYFQV
jgi:hypothetical protein